MKKIAISAIVALAFGLSGCAGEPEDIDDSGALRVQELRERQFTNIQLESAASGFWSGHHAKANVSVGGCRLALSWGASDGWFLTDNSVVDLGKGELNANNIAKAKEYQDCAKQPAPLETPAPK